MNLLKNKNNLIILAIIFGLFIDILSFIKKSVASLIINVSFFILILITFLKIDFNELKRIKKFIKPTLIVVLFDYLFFPIFIFFLIKYNLLSVDLAIPLIFLILAPSAISTIYLVSLVKGYKEESLFLVLFTHISFIFVLPFIMFIYDRFLEIDLKISFILRILFIFLVIPMIISWIIQKTRFYKKIDKYYSLLQNFSFLLLVTIIFVTISLNFSSLSKNPVDYLKEILVILIYFILFFFISHFFFRKNIKEEKTVFLELIYKNYVVTLILLQNLNSEFLILPIVYIVLANILLYFYLSFFER